MTQRGGNYRQDGWRLERSGEEVGGGHGHFDKVGGEGALFALSETLPLGGED